MIKLLKFLLFGISPICGRKHCMECNRLLMKNGFR